MVEPVSVSVTPDAKSKLENMKTFELPSYSKVVDDILRRLENENGVQIIELEKQNKELVLVNKQLERYKYEWREVFEMNAILKERMKIVVGILSSKE